MTLNRNTSSKGFFPPIFTSRARIRSVGTAAVNMCLVATGGADAYYEMGIHCWDMAGAGVIVTEAGGVLMDVTGEVMAPRSICRLPFCVGSKKMADSCPDRRMGCAIFYKIRQ